MFLKYTNLLFEELVAIGFTVGESTLGDKKITDETELVVLHKRENATHYVAILVNIEKFNLDNYKKMQESIKLQFSNPMITAICKNIVILNIFIGNESIPIIDSTIKNAPKYIDQYYYEIFWVLRDGGNKIEQVVSKNQPTDVASVKKAINRAYKSYKEGAVIQSEPLKDIVRRVRKENPLQVVNRYANLTFMTIVFCVLYFIIVEFSGGTNDINNIMRFGALEKNSVLNNQEYYRLITSMFMHSGYIHLFSNMLALSIFGSRLEKYMGSLHFLLIFLIGGLFGNILTIMFSSYVSVGASGSIFALMGTLYVLSKRFNKTIDGLDEHLFFMFIFVNIGIGFLVPNINNIAHLGGLVFGLLAGYLYNPEIKNK